METCIFLKNIEYSFDWCFEVSSINSTTKYWLHSFVSIIWKSWHMYGTCMKNYDGLFWGIYKFFWVFLKGLNIHKLVISLHEMFIFMLRQRKKLGCWIETFVTIAVVEPAGCMVDMASLCLVSYGTSLMNWRMVPMSDRVSMCGLGRFFSIKHLLHIHIK